MEWARQVTSALIHINEEAGTFYSDLRPDNVLLSSSSKAGQCEDIVLCDFEQRGNWHEWCLPEVLYRVYVENLRSHADLSSHPRKDLVSQYSVGTSSGVAANTFVAKHTPHGRNPVWFDLSSNAREAAQVYSLGLLIYCIFEGISNVKINIVNSWPYEPDIAFPKFRNSPSFIRNLVKACTAGAWQWEAEEWDSEHTETKKEAPQPVTRIGEKLYPDGKLCADADHEPLGVSWLVVETARLWWESELDRAKTFLDRERDGTLEIRRPKLRDVLAHLEDAVILL